MVSFFTLLLLLRAINLLDILMRIKEMLGVKNAQTIQKLIDMLELDTSEHVRILVTKD